MELAARTKGFGSRALRAALDSSPLWGAGRVEDTFNLTGHALRKALARMPAERKAALRAVPVEKSADRMGDLGGEVITNDPVELLKRSLRRPMSLGQIEKIANG